MNCPNPQCKTKDLPNEARFCPNCGTKILPSKVVVSSCIVTPDCVNLGDNCEIQWQGDYIRHVIIDELRYTQNPIVIQPKQTQTIDVKFVGLDGTVLIKQINVTVINPESKKRVRVIYV